MQWVDSNKVEWQRFAAHRPGFAENKRLLVGDRHAPTNFELSIVHVDSVYSTPRHKHNFDQIRVMLSGDFGYDKSDVLREGSISYFPEGTPYIQRSEGESVTLLLQFGGASGSGFMSYADLDRGKVELESQGAFEEGNFIASGSNSGLKKDAYEAIWEHVSGREIKYPPLRYKSPAVMDPNGFEWIEAVSESGVFEKSVGRFSERDIGMGYIRVKSGCAHTLIDDRLYYLLSGNGRCGEHVWTEGVAVNAQSDGPHSFEAAETSEFVYMDRPRFEAVQAAAAVA